MLALLFAGFNLIKAQSTNPEPKLVVGIVIDQMRYDYLYRFESLYGNDGFKKLRKGLTLLLPISIMFQPIQVRAILVYIQARLHILME
jgi:predicted AlkP superfamily pyrophosphatase or phosphodiesterase